jgi:hypothetical protein
MSLQHNDGSGTLLAQVGDEPPFSVEAGGSKPIQGHSDTITVLISANDPGKVVCDGHSFTWPATFGDVIWLNGELFQSCKSLLSIYREVDSHLYSADIRIAGGLGSKVISKGPCKIGPNGVSN